MIFRRPIRASSCARRSCSRSALNGLVTRIQAIIAERRGITGDTALRLGRYFGTTPEFWLNMQRDFELEQAREALGERLEREVQPRAA